MWYHCGCESESLSLLGAGSGTRLHDIGLIKWAQSLMNALMHQSELSNLLLIGLAGASICNLCQEGKFWTGLGQFEMMMKIVTLETETGRRVQHTIQLSLSNKGR